MAATAQMKEGNKCDLLARLAAEPAFGMTEEEMEAVLTPSAYIGRCPEQVERSWLRSVPCLRTPAPTSRKSTCNLRITQPRRRRKAVCGARLRHGKCLSFPTPLKNFCILRHQFCKF